jgi:hypothetical protein
VNLSGELNGLFGDSDSAEEELLKETPILTPATTQAPTLVVEQAATAATIQLPGQTTRKTRRRIDSATESEPELILTAENEEEELKNVALKTLPQDQAVEKIEKAAKKFDLAAKPMIH